MDTMHRERLQNGSTAEGEPDLNGSLEDLQVLLDSGKIKEARAVVKTAADQYPESEYARQLRRKLSSTLIRIRSGPKLPTHEQEMRWLSRYAVDYPGQWLAVLGDQLVACDSTLDGLHEKLREVPDGQLALLHRQPRDSEWP